MKTILLTGGTGLIGELLQAELHEAGYQVKILSRSQKPDSHFYQWDPNTQFIQDGALDQVDTIINLAGENLADKRWTPKQKEKIRSSRVNAIKTLKNKLTQGNHSVKTFISASAIGYYGTFTSEGILTESDPPGSDFLANVCRSWEAAADEIEHTGIRTAIVRIGVVLSSKGGALKKFLIPAKLGLGGPLGSGRQWIPWIHIKDVSAIIRYIIDHKHLHGHFNAVAPNPVRQKSLMKVLSKTIKRPYLGIPVPAFLLDIALGELAIVSLKGTRVKPAHLEDQDFSFEFPGIKGALEDILTKTST